MMVAVPHLQFRQIIAWDKGSMGMGWHYRRSYEVILEAQRKGAPCKWYDKTRKVENIIRPGDYGVRKTASDRKAPGTGRALHKDCTPSREN